MQLCIELLAIYCRCFALVRCTQMYDAWWMHSLSTLERSEQHVNSFETSQLFLSWSRWARVRHHRVVEFWSWVHPYWRFDWKVSPLKRGGVLIGRNLGVLSCQVKEVRSAMSCHHDYGVILWITATSADLPQIGIMFYWYYFIISQIHYAITLWYCLYILYNDEMTIELSTLCRSSINIEAFRSTVLQQFFQDWGAKYRLSMQSFWGNQCAV